MAATTEARKVFANRQGNTTLVCPKCTNSKAVNVAKYRNSQTSIKAKCGCGYIFDVHGIRDDLRKFYRKKANLPGSYSRVTDDKKGIMMVKDLSYSGLRFKTDKDDDEIEKEDILGVRFILNDERKTEICRSVIVKNIQGRYIGVEFSDCMAYEIELVQYLMLS